MNATQRTSINVILSSPRKHENFIEKIVKSKSFAQRAPNTHNFFSTLWIHKQTRGAWTDKQKLWMVREIEKHVDFFFPVIVVQSASDVELQEMNRHASNDADGAVEQIIKSADTDDLPF